MAKPTLARWALCALVGCAPAALPHRSADHPANPAAADGVVPWRSDVLTSATVENLATGEHAAAHHRSGGGETIYTCPMHPAVQESEPGRCARCGMRLVPQDRAELGALQTPHARTHEGERQ